MKDDKKKVMAIGALILVLAAVGAFTFLGGSTPPPVDKTAKKETKAANAEYTPDEDALKNPLYAADLPQRDPFQPHALEGSEQPPTPTKTLPEPTKPRRSHSGGGSTPPFNPMAGALPPAGMSGAIGLNPAGPDPSEFNYNVSGVIVGQRPAAVFTDSQGNQRLVPVGGSLDGDSKVISVTKGQVTVQFRGKTLRLSLGGNPK